jgi:antitoxin ParD1/3/4
MEPNGEEQHIGYCCHVTNELSMPSKSTLSVSLTVELTAHMAAKISTGHEPKASEVVRAALRLLDEQDQREDRSSNFAEGGCDAR